MSQIKLDTARLYDFANRLESINVRLRNLDRKLDNYYLRVGIKGSINLYLSDARIAESNIIKGCINYLRDTATDFENLEKGLVFDAGHASGTSKYKAPSIAPINTKRTTAKVPWISIAVAPIISAGAKVIIPTSIVTSLWEGIVNKIFNTGAKKASENNDVPNQSNISISNVASKIGEAIRVATTPVSEVSIATTEGILPEWAKAPGATTAHYTAADGTVGSVYEYNRTGQLSCTYYTLRRLRERGLGFPFKTAGNASGGYWYGNCTDDVPKYGGSNCFDDLAASQELPVKNVVVSFPEPSPWGHVVLIDEISRDANGTVQIIYSDMWPDIADLNGTNKTEVRTIEGFKQRYLPYNGAVTGCVIVGS